MAGKQTKTKVHQSSLVNVPTHLRQLSVCLETETSEDYDWRQIQHCLEVIQKLCSSSMYERRAVSSKENAGIPTLLRILEAADSSSVILTILDILNILCEHKHKLKLVEADSVGALISSFARQKGKKCSSDTRIHHLQLLLKLSPKDKTFTTKARLLGAIPCVHVFLQDLLQSKQDSGDISTVIHTIRILASSSVNVISFHCIGTSSLLLKLMQNCKLKNLNLLRCTADAVSSLLKQKDTSTKVAQRTVVSVLPLIEDLHALDRQQRHSSVHVSLLSCLRTAIIHSGSCKEVFVGKNGPSKLYTLATFWNEGRTKEMIELATITCRILKHCLPQITIEVPGFAHPLAFPLPEKVYALVPDGDTTASDDDDDGDVVSSTTDEDVQGTGPSTESSVLTTTVEFQDGLEPSIVNCTKVVDSSKEEISSLIFPEKIDRKMPVILSHELVDTSSLNPTCNTVCEELLEITGNSVPTSTNSLPEHGVDLKEKDSVSHCENDWIHTEKRVQSDTNLSHKLSSCDISESSNSVEWISSQQMRLAKFDEFFPELFSSTSDSLACSSLDKEEGGLVLESLSLPELVEGRDNVKTVYSDELLLAPPEVDYGIHTIDKFRETPPFVHYKDNVSNIPEPQYKKMSSLDRNLTLHNIWRYINSNMLINKVVYDVDEELKTGTLEAGGNEHVLRFDGRFECGNLRRAVHVYGTEYDLLLSSDINSTHHHQWFCFKISGMESGVPYVFNIINCEKRGSQFNAGMQPVLFSMKEAELTGTGWYRSGENVAYYSNQFNFMDSLSGDFVKNTGYTATFAISFPHVDDTCYLAYHYPYLYSDLMGDLHSLEQSVDKAKIFYSRQALCTTLGGNECPIVTITGLDEEHGVADGREYVVLSGRVHPGETNSSWVMRGVLKFLTSSDPLASLLRDRFIFKIIPMLNPDGVVNGSHRCSLSGSDLNRQWACPDPTLHPTIYNAKCILQWLMNRQKPPLLYCDFHGHSQIKNVVLYGCPDPSGGTATEEFPKILTSVAPAFNLKGCKYKLEKSKEGAARVVVWRMGVVRSYTMESSYCGAGTGKYKGMQFNTGHLEEMGVCFCHALLSLGDAQWKTERKQESQHSGKTFESTTVDHEEERS